MSSIIDSILGAWTLVSQTATLASDPSDIIYPSGRSPKGMIMYTPDGHMSAHVLDPGQKGYAKKGIGEGTVEEYAESARRYIGYAGTFDVTENKEGKPLLVHHVYVSVLPDWMGVGQERVIEIEGDQMTLKANGLIKVEGQEREVKIVWKRAGRYDPLHK